MRVIYFVALLSVILTSCSPTLTPFTQNLYEQYNWTNDQLSQIQFYLSDDIVLSRVVGQNESAITNGSIRVIDGRRVEQIVFKKGTPGVYVFSPKDQKFGVSFDTDDSKFLMFGPNPKMSERFVLLAKDWSGGVGKVSYDGQVYETSNASAYATLMIDLKRAQKTSYQSTVVSGRKIN